MVSTLSVAPLTASSVDQELRPLATHTAMGQGVTDHLVSTLLSSLARFTVRQPCTRATLDMTSDRSPLDMSTIRGQS